jgi:hypothetical protein
MDRAAYERYLALFNARDYEAVLAHFTDDLEVVFAGYALRSKQQVRDFYAFLHSHVREEIAVTRYLSDGSTIALEAAVRLTGIKPLTPEILAEKGFARLVAPPVGVTVEIPQFIHYHLKDGKFAKAYCAVFEPPQD